MANDQTITLSIKISADEARAILGDVTGDFKEVVAEVKAFAPPADALKTELTNLSRQLKSSADMALLFGRDTDLLKEQQQALRNTARSLIDQGLNPQSAELKELKAQYDSLGKEMAETNTQTNKGKSGFGDMSMVLMKATAAIGAIVAAARAIASVTGEFASAEASTDRFNLALQRAGMEKSRPALENLANTLKHLAGVDDDLIKQYEAEMVVQGKTENQIKKTMIAAAGLSAVNGDELSVSFQKVNSTFSGASGGIGKLIPELKDLTDEQLKAGVGADVLAQRYEGFIGQSGKTSIALQKIKVYWGDILESAGQLFAPLIQDGANAIEAVSTSISGANDTTNEWATTIQGIARALFSGFKVTPETAANLKIIGDSLLKILQDAQPVIAFLSKQFGEQLNQHIAMLAWMINTASELFGEYIDFYTALSTGDWASAWNALQRIVLSWAKGIASAVELGTKAAVDGINKIIELANKVPGVNLKPIVMDLQLSKWLDDQLKKLEKVNDLKKGGKVQAPTVTPKGSAPTSGGGGLAGTVPSSEDMSSLYAFQMQILADSASLEDQFSAKMMKLDEDHVNALQKAADLAKKAGLNQVQSSALVSTIDAANMVKRTAEENDYAAKQRANIFDLANKERAAAVALTESKVDDLMLQRDRELDLFVGTSKAKAALSEQWAKKIADTKIDEAKRAAAAHLAAMKQAFEDQKKLAAENGDWAGYAGAEFESQAANTNVGKLAGFAGTEATDPMQFLIEEGIKLALSFDSINEALNFVTTFMDDLKPILDPLISDALAPILGFLKALAVPVSQILAPFISIVALVFRLNPYFELLKIAVQIVGAALAWLNDYVIVPLGNGIIGVINGIIKGVNGFINGINGFLDSIGLGKWKINYQLSTIALLQTTAQFAAQSAATAAAQDKINDAMSDINDVFKDKADELKKAYDDNIGSLSNLLELGVVSEQEYASRVAGYNDALALQQDALDAAKETEIAKVKALSTALENGTLSVADALSQLSSILAANGLNAETSAAGASQVSQTSSTSTDNVWTQLYKAGMHTLNEKYGEDLSKIGIKLPSYDVGAWDIPETQTAKIHKGEMILPASISQSIRSGNLSSNANGISGTKTTIYQTSVTVEGSIAKEDDLADSIATKVNRRIKRGQYEEVD